MLTSLRIKNLALVDELRWELGPGFNALTGETGAGKSILLDALMLLAGERADKSLIRSGETTCAVEGELELPAPVLVRVAPLLEEIGAEPCEENRLLLKRSIAAGSGRQFINGSAVTLQALAQLGNLWLDVHGPHDHQSLLRPAEQLRVLDGYGKTVALRDRVAKAYDGWKNAAAERAALAMSEEERQERIDRLRAKHQEIENAKLEPGEDERVESDFRVAHHGRQLLEWAAAVQDHLSDAENAALAQLAQVEKILSAWQKIDPAAEAWSEQNHAAIATLQDLAASVRDRAERIDLDAAALSRLEDRMSLLHTLKKKYGPTLADVIAKGVEAGAELQRLESNDETLAELTRREAAALAELNKLAKDLSGARRKTAGPLAKTITEELHGLGFKAASFAVDLKPRPEATRTGADEIEFIFAPNVGEAPQPLRAIASSGEMARVMLAIKTTLAEVDEIPVLVFDEVDANIGGETAWEVGKKLGRLGASRQVLCVTHQPQVAAQGKSHFHVAKQVTNGRTTTQLQHLDKTTRVKELSRMLGGQNKESQALAERMMEGKRK